LPLVFDELLSQTDSTLRAKLVNILNHVLTRAKGNTVCPSFFWMWEFLACSHRYSLENFGKLLPGLDSARAGVEHFLPLFSISLPPLWFRSCTSLIESLSAALPDCFLLLLKLTAKGVFGRASPRKTNLSRERDAKPEFTRMVLVPFLPIIWVAAFFQSAVEFLLIPCGATEA
ncbi:unnamed protein product, partial [Durusdinium trenchii]